MSARNCAIATFTLNAAKAIGISAGTNGIELLMSTPLSVPRDVRVRFEKAFHQYREDIIKLILAEHSERGGEPW
jgi:hypothetical protein